MQQKNNSAVNPFILFAIFIGGAIVALPIRVYQLLTIIEPGTGFWNTVNISVYILFAVVAIAVLACWVIPFAKKKSFGVSPVAWNKKPIVGIISFLVVATLLYNAIKRYGDFSTIYFDYATSGTTLTLKEYLTKSGAIAMAAEAFFAVISSVYFLLFGISCLTGKNPSEYKLVAIAPVVWCIFRIIHRFMRTISFMNVSELFFELCMIVFVMMFFMAFAQITARVNGEGLEWKMFGYGLPAALFCLICCVPRIIVMVLGKSSVLTDKSPVEYCDIAVAAFIISILVSRAKISAPVKLEKEETQASDEE